MTEEAVKEETNFITDKTLQEFSKHHKFLESHFISARTGYKVDDSLNILFKEILARKTAKPADANKKGITLTQQSKDASKKKCC